MACRTRFACLAILTALAAVACFAPVASAGVFTPLQLSKSGPTYVNQGDSAEYTFSLYNSSDSDVTDVTVADDKCSPLSGPSGDGGDGILNPDETWTYTCSYVPSGSPGDEIDNHATADGTIGGETPVHADAYHTTWITALHVKKSVDLASADPFDDLHYTITLSNDGPQGFTYQGYLEDEGCEDLSSDSENTKGPFFGIGGGESVTYTCQHNFAGPDDYTNTACAHADVYQALAFASIQGEGYDLNVCDSATTTLAKHFVTGTIFEDMNADGVRQAGEPPLSGVVVYADLNGNGRRDAGEPSATSDGQGNYSLRVELGKTTIREEVPGGFTCSFPSGCAYSVDLPKNSPPEPPPIVLLRSTAARADDPSGKDFGNWRPASVSGTVIADDNGNGVRDSGERGLAGVAVFADLDGNGILDQGEPTATSAADGTYALTGLKPGAYLIRHVLQGGRRCTVPVGDCTHHVTLTSGGVAAGRDFLDSRGAQAVLAARVAGAARMRGATGCVFGRAFDARIRGRAIQKVTIRLDGRVVKTLTGLKDNRTYRYRVNVAKLRRGTHSVRATVTFRRSSGTKTKTLRLTFQRCVRQVSAPQFTG